MNIDQVDMDLMKYTWKPDRGGYLRRTTTIRENGRPRTIKPILHRVIAERVAGRKLLSSEVVDHLNHIKTDNRRENLRITTALGNSRNRLKKGGSSRFIGVTWHRQMHRWQAQIRLLGRTLYLGIFQNDADAAAAYNRKAEELGFITRNTI